MLLKRFHDAAIELMKLERRVDPFFRPALDAVLREPLAALIQALINLRRRDEGLRLAEEQPLPGEEAFLDSIIADMAAYMRLHYTPGEFQRAGNTKTHGMVRGEFTVRDDVPAEWRRGVFAEPRTFRAWVRFAGPGPASPPDIEEVGVLSIGAKLMGVPGPKLLDDERHTQDFMGISAPTFTTPDVRENAKLQAASLKGTPLFYFINPFDSHLLDGVMQGLWARTQTSPFETAYWGCAPYLLGEGRAMQYSFRPDCEPGAGCPACRGGRPITTFARRWPPRWRGRTSSSTFSCRYRPTPIACPSRTRRCAGPSGCRARCRSRPCGCPASGSTAPRSSRSLTTCPSTRGTACPSIARSGTRTGRAVASTGSSPGSGSP